MGTPSPGSAGTKTAPGRATPSPGSRPSAVTTPRPAPGTEGSTGAAPSTAGALDPSGPAPTARELEMRRKSEMIDRKVRRGICVGC